MPLEASRVQSSTASDDRSEVAAVFADELAFRAWYERSLPRVYAYLFHRCGRDPELLEDVRASVGLASGVAWSPDGRRLLFVLWDSEASPAYAIVSIAADGPPDLRVLTPWSVALYNARLQDLSWQAVEP
jgi:hypothetical protein